jgi:hypothetical protein
VLQIFERKPTTVKNFGIWVRYQSRTGEQLAVQRSDLCKPVHVTTAAAYRPDAFDEM